MANLEPVIIAGIEIECAYNDKIIGRINSRGYHSSDSPEFGTSFVAENDSSISSTKTHSRTAEIISFPFDSRDYKSVLADFQAELVERYMSVNGELDRVPELAECVDFNRSTGCHIHMSVLAKGTGKDKRKTFSYKKRKLSRACSSFGFTELVDFNTLKAIKDSIANRVSKELPHVYKDGWFEQYDNRNYAKKTTKKSMTRGSDWNFTTGIKDHVEFRAFNLVGVKTWIDFYHMFSIAFEELQNIFAKKIKTNRLFEETITFEHNDFDKTETKHKDAFELDKVKTKYVRHVGMGN